MKYRNVILSLMFLSLGIFLTGCYTQFAVYQKRAPKNHYYQDQYPDTTYQSDEQAENPDTNYYVDDGSDSNGQVEATYNYNFYPHRRYYWGYQPSFGFSMVYDPIWDDPWGYWYDPFYPAYWSSGYGYYYGGWGSPWYGHGPIWNDHNYGHGRPGDIGHIRNGVNGRGNPDGRSLTRLNGSISRPTSGITKTRDGNTVRSSRSNETGVIRKDTRNSRSSDTRVSSTPGKNQSGRATVRTDTRRNSSPRGSAVRSDNRGRNNAPNREARRNNSSNERRVSQGSSSSSPSHQRVQSPSGGSSRGSSSGGGRSSEPSSHSRGR
jgi:hypothetical protein